MDSHQVFVWSSTFFAIAILSVLFLVLLIQTQSPITGKVTQSSEIQPQFNLNDKHELVVQFSGKHEQVIEKNVDCFAVQKNNHDYQLALVQSNQSKSLFTAAFSDSGNFSVQNHFDSASCPVSFLDMQGKVWVKAGVLNYPFSKN